MFPIDGQKMSKSRGNIINIFLADKPLKKQIMSIETDSTPLEEPKILILVKFLQFILYWQTKLKLQKCELNIWVEITVTDTLKPNY